MKGYAAARPRAIRAIPRSARPPRDLEATSLSTDGLCDPTLEVIKTDWTVDRRNDLTILNWPHLPREWHVRLCGSRPGRVEEKAHLSVELILSGYSQRWNVLQSISPPGIHATTGSS
jgi:hypothetical protein